MSEDEYMQQVKTLHEKVSSILNWHADRGMDIENASLTDLSYSDLVILENMLGTTEDEMFAMMLYNKYCDFTRRFVSICRNNPGTTADKIPEAMEALSECDEFERMSEKYLGFRFNHDRYRFEKVED